MRCQPTITPHKVTQEHVFLHMLYSSLFYTATAEADQYQLCSYISNAQLLPYEFLFEQNYRLQKIKNIQTLLSLFKVRQRCLSGHQMSEGLAQQKHTCIHRMWNNAAAEVDVVGAIAGGTTYQIIVCHLVQHGNLRLMNNHNGNMMVKWGTFRP